MTGVSNVRKLVTWHVTVLMSDVLTVTTLDMLLQIALMKYCLQAHQHTAERTPPVDMTDHHLDIIATPDIPTMIIGTDTGSVVLNPAHVTLDTGVTAAMTPTGVTPDHSTDPHIIVLHTTGAPAHIATAVTHHIADPNHAGISPKMTVDQKHIILTRTTTNLHKDHVPVHSPHPGSLKTEGTNKLPLMIHPWSITALKSKTVIQRMI